MKELTLKSTLEELGYPLKNCGNYYKTRAIYRGGQDMESVAIYPDTGLVIDFVANEKMSVRQLIGRTLNIDEYNLDIWLKNKNVLLPSYKDSNERPLIREATKISPDYLTKLEPNHQYWIKRGIPLEVMEKFRGGVSHEGKMKNRYVFPVIDSRNQIIGLSGRDLGNRPMKWKQIGWKSEWKYPFFLNYDIIQEKREIIIVESIGDCLSLFASGIQNVGVSFGLNLDNGIINFIMASNPSKIVLSFNRDSNGAGQAGALKAWKKLNRYFNAYQIQVKLPNEVGDFNEILLNKGPEYIQKFFENK